MNWNIRKGSSNSEKKIKKAKKSGSDPYLALLELRNTPLDGLGSPVQLLYAYMGVELGQFYRLRPRC